MRENLQSRETEESEILRSSNKEEIGKLYDKKLQEFLQVRDMMFKLQEVSSEEIELPKPQKAPVISTEIHQPHQTYQQQPKTVQKNRENLLASPRLYEFVSPMNMTATPMGDLPNLSAKDLLPSPIATEKVMKKDLPSKRSDKENVKSSDRNSQLTKDDSRFSFNEKAAAKPPSKNFPTLVSEPSSADLKQHAAVVPKNIEIHTYSDPNNQRNSAETNAVLQKIKDMLDNSNTNTSVMDLSKDELLQRYSKLNGDLYQLAMEKGSAGLSKRDFTLQDSARVLDTPTLFSPLDMQISSRVNSSVIETDMSILAINQRIDELKHEKRHY